MNHKTIVLFVSFAIIRIIQEANYLYYLNAITNTVNHVIKNIYIRGL